MHQLVHVVAGPQNQLAFDYFDNQNYLLNNKFLTGKQVNKLTYVNLAVVFALNYLYIYACN